MPHFAPAKEEGGREGSISAVVPTGLQEVWISAAGGMGMAEGRGGGGAT